jgi:hypothetical protein
MSEPIRLRLHEKQRELMLPEQCSVAISACEAQEIDQIVAARMEQVLYALALDGFDLRSLDGITLSRDCRKDGTALQNIPEGEVPSEAADRSDMMEMARTVAVWRGSELRFHIVLRTGIGLMTLSPEKEQQALAYACIAHEAAHVDHEGRLYRTFPHIYGCSLPCGDRQRRTFIQAMDVWSEYAASRSSARFRPEAVEEFEALFCRALEESLAASSEPIGNFRQDGQASEAPMDIPYLLGDVFVHAGYFLGHLDGLELTLENDAPRASALLSQHVETEALVMRLRSALHGLWLTEDDWKSVEVFGPIYDLICEMTAYTKSFAEHQNHQTPS